MKKLSCLLFICLLAGCIKAQTPEIIPTDSSVIEIKIYPGGKQVREKMTGKNLIYHRFYYRKTNIIISIGTYDTLEHRTGIREVFDTTGNLLYTCDYDNRTWRPVQENLYPHRLLLEKMKEKGDSIIRKTYGDNFFYKYVKWNFDCCAVYGSEKDYFARSWTEPFEKEPVEFLLRYDIQVDDSYLAEEKIEFEIDINGNFIPNQYQEIYGFEELQGDTNNTFKLTLQGAIDKAKQYGMKETDSMNATAFLKWVCFKSNQFYNGRYLFYVVQNTKTEKKTLEQPDTYVITFYFDVWTFSPWTGDFIEKKKMHSKYYKEKYGGFKSGLIEDK